MGILEGKVAIITGAAHGLGRSHALLMAQEGANIVINDIGANVDGEGKTTGPADDVVNEIKAAGGKAIASYESVIDFQGAKRIIDCAIDTFGKLDILVNNAGFLREKMTFNMTEEEWDSVVDVHLKGTFNCSRWACAYFRDQGKAGKLKGARIINTVSHAGLSGAAGQPNYSAAKAGIAALTMVWAREMAKYNFTCNAIVPIGRTRMTNRSENLQVMFAKPAEGEFDKYAPENVSPIVAYLASDAAKDITGRLFSMRGGILEVFIPWSSGGLIDIGRRWTVKDIAQRIHELGNLSMPSGPAI